MPEFLIETHCHTSETSRCGKVAAERVAQMYIEAGYSGIIITDHMNANYHGIDSEKWEDKIDHYLSGYRTVKKASGDKLDILLGMELTLEGSANDYLVYGLTEELIYKYNNEQLDFRRMNIKKFKEFADDQGLIVIQAHPFRNNMTVVKPIYLHGIEVYNGNPRQESRNDIALLWAEKFGLKMTSGSDFHQEPDIARGGIITNHRIRTNEMLIETLKGGNYSLKSSDDSPV